MLAVLGKLPFWIWLALALIVTVVVMQATSTTDDQVGLYVHDKTVAVIKLTVVLLPFVAGFVGVLALGHVVHDHARAIVLGIGAVLLGLTALIWHMGAGTWLLAHWLVVRSA